MFLFRSMLVILALSAALAHAGAPDLQTWRDPSVVRVVVNNNSFNGSATVIGHKQIGNDGWLCFLTADHVVSSTATAAGATHAQVGFAWGDGANANLNATPVANASMMFRKAGAAVDLAVFGVKYGAFNPAYDALVREVYAYNSTNNVQITSVGYGSTGAYVPQVGYVRARNSWQTQRYVNNQADSFRTWSPFGGYTFDAMEWDVDQIGTAGAVDGEGTIMDGDSGGATYFSSPVSDARFNPNPMVFTDKIIGVNSYNFQDYTDPQYPDGVIRWGSKNGTVKITNAYKQWIDRSCEAVPEPTSMLALALGCGILLKRKLKK